MALHGNKPIRLSYSNNRVHYPAARDGNRRMVTNSVPSPNSHLSPERRRRLRIARIRRLRQQRLMRLRSTTMLPPTTATPTPTITTPLPTTPETTTSWYDPWPVLEGQSSTPGGYTDSFLDYNYEFKIDDY